MVYENVKRLADAQGMSIRAVEIKAGLANGAISNWQKNSPLAVNLAAVAKVLHTTVETLLTERKED